MAPSVVRHDHVPVNSIPTCLALLFPQGYGTNFYSAEEYYEGEWYADKRSGWGRMYYADGSIYEGEWYNDQRSGQGMLRLGMWCYIILNLNMRSVPVAHDFIRKDKQSHLEV